MALGLRRNRDNQSEINCGRGSEVSPSPFSKEFDELLDCRLYRFALVDERTK